MYLFQIFDRRCSLTVLFVTLRDSWSVPYLRSLQTTSPMVRFCIPELDVDAAVLGRSIGEYFSDMLRIGAEDGELAGLGNVCPGCAVLCWSVQV